MNIWVISSLVLLQSMNCNEVFLHVQMHIVFIDECKIYVHVFNEKCKL